MRQSAVIQRNWQSLIKPEKLEVEPGADPARMATIIAEPLERGFGMTLGNAIAWSSSGSQGFKGSRKSTPYAAQVAAEDAGKKAREHGMETLDIEVSGPGSGRESALRALQAVGFQVGAIRDMTPIPHNGCRPRKRRRV